MEQQHQGGQDASGQAQSSRPALDGRTESSLPAHFRSSVTSVPVTPGINPDTYRQTSEDNGDNGGQGAHSPNYFSRVGGTVDPVTGAPLTSSEAAGAITGDDIASRLSLAALERKESLSEMQSAYPGLSLSGNIISATFNIPHSLRYHKGADWVSFFCLFNCLVLCPFLCAATAMTISWWDGGANTCDFVLVITGAGTPPWSVCPLRLLFLPIIRRLSLEPHCRCLDW